MEYKDVIVNARLEKMSVKDVPVSNRYLDVKEKERAYKRHLKAISNAKATIDTSTPVIPNRIRVKSQTDNKYRQSVLKEIAMRDKMLLEMREDPREEEEEVDDQHYLKKFAEYSNRIFELGHVSIEDIKIGFTEALACPVNDDTESRDPPENCHEIAK